MRTGDSPRPAGLLPRGRQLLVTDVRGADTLGLTVEPHTGSKAPTSAPIVALSV